MKIKEMIRNFFKVQVEVCTTDHTDGNFYGIFYANLREGVQKVSSNSYQADRKAVEGHIWFKKIGNSWFGVFSFREMDSEMLDRYAYYFAEVEKNGFDSFWYEEFPISVVYPPPDPDSFDSLYVISFYGLQISGGVI